MGYDHSTKSIKVMLFNICKLTVLKSYGGNFFSVGVTQRMFAAVFNSRKSWNSEKVPMDGGGESSLSNVKTLNRLVLGSQPGKGFQNQGMAQRTTEELTAKLVSINMGLHKLSYLTFMKLKI